MNGNEATLMDAIWGCGTMGKFHWLLIALLTCAGISLGFAAIMSSIRFKGDKFPLPIKILFCFIAATLLAGMSGTLAEYVGCFASLATVTGAAKAQMLKLSMKLARMIFHASLLSAAIQAILVAVSFFIMQKKSELPSSMGLSPMLYFRKISPFVYAASLNFLFLIGFACFSIWSIETIVLLRPGDIEPSVFGVDFHSITLAGMTCAGAELVLLTATFILSFRRR
jgi:hypothetical protein